MADQLTNWVNMALLALPMALRSERRYRELPQIPADAVTGHLPALSIIIPARNEATNLRRLLPSLSAASYPGPWELIVVDDNSSDETAFIARQFGATVVSLTELPEGWLGKPHACHQGAKVAAGEWLLFIDADTVHDPCGPAQAVSYAARNRLDGLSAFLGHTPAGTVDRLALMVAFAGLFTGAKASDPLLNGQYILLRRAVYEDSGGFAAVASEYLEDLALGRHLRKSGYRVPILQSEHVARVQMYKDKRSLMHGMARLGAGSLRWLGLGSIVTALFITAVMAPVLALAVSLAQGRQRRWALVSWMAVAFGFVPWARRFGSTWLALLAPIGALMVQLAAVWGLGRRLLGRGLRWKGRVV